VRNQAIAIVAVLALSFAIEPTLLALAPDVARFGPMIGLPTAAADISAEDIGFDNVDFVAPGVAVALLLAWIGVFFAAGATLLRRRDVD
jgi:hypothetical protein